MQNLTTCVCPVDLYSCRDDNRTHVYDSRMLKRRGMLEKRGVLYDFKHAETRFSATGQKSFGVVGVKWVQTRASRLGLVTGGNDGMLAFPSHSHYGTGERELKNYSF